MLRRRPARRRHVLARAVDGVDGSSTPARGSARAVRGQEFEAVNVRATATLIRARRGSRRAAGRARQLAQRLRRALRRCDRHRGQRLRRRRRASAAATRARSSPPTSVASDAMRGGAPVTIVRPGSSTAPVARRRWRGASSRSGRCACCSPARDYLLPLAYVDNVADAIVLAAARGRAPRGRAYTIVDVHARQADYARLYRQVSGGALGADLRPARRWCAPRRARRSAPPRLLGRRAADHPPPGRAHGAQRDVRHPPRRTTSSVGSRAYRVEEALRRSFAARRRRAAEPHRAARSRRHERLRRSGSRSAARDRSDEQRPDASRPMTRSSSSRRRAAAWSAAR